MPRQGWRWAVREGVFGLGIAAVCVAGWYGVIEMNQETQAPPSQGSPQWLAERLGHVTASKFEDVLKKGRSKASVWGDGATTYALTLAAERLTGVVAGGYATDAMDWGTQHEPDAVAAYELTQLVNVKVAPFVRHPLIDNVGGSPDGFVFDDGILEVKCPYTSKEHLRTVWDGSMPEHHRPQVQGNLWITGRDWCDFVSYDPRMPEECRLFISRVERDAEYIKTLSDRVEAFAALVSEMVEVCGAQQ